VPRRHRDADRLTDTDCHSANAKRGRDCVNNLLCPCRKC
jgi:hypothetical protein